MSPETSLAEPWPTARTGRGRFQPPPSLTAHGPEDDDATRPSPLADIHIDLPAEGEPGGDDTLVELPMDDGDDAGDTLPMPL